MANTPKGNKSTASQVLTKTAGYFGSALSSYLSEAMPTSASIISDARSTVRDVSGKLKSTSQSINGFVKSLKGQSPIKMISNWYLHGEEEFGDGLSDIDELDFDIPTDSGAAEIAVTEISESKQNAKQIASSVISSSAKLMEGNMQLTANILASLDNQTSVITSGFNSVNQTLTKITEAIAANQEAILNATKANAEAVEELAAATDHNAAMLSGGKFSLDQYKKIISQNIKNDPTLGMLAAYLPLITNKDMLKGMLSPGELIKGGVTFGLNKIFPELNKTLSSLDKILNAEIMNALTSIGDRGGILGDIFGVKSDKNIKAGQGRAAFEVKATQFDTLTKEAITVTIPGYLQKILAAISGENTVYDMRSRSFTTKGNQANAYKDAILRRNTIYNATDNIQNIFNGDYGKAFYDLMMADLGNKSARSSDRRTQINKFRDEGEFVKYATDLMQRVGIQQDNAQTQWFKRVEELLRRSPHSNIRDISNQVATENVYKNQAAEEYNKTAQLYQTDLSGVKLTDQEELRRLARKAGFKLTPDNSQEITGTKSASSLAGVDYTNKALYEIYSILHRGINVYQVGQSASQTKKYPDTKADLDKHLKPPRANNRSQGSSFISASTNAPAVPSPVMQEMMADSSEDEPKIMDQLKSAIFSGDSDAIQRVFGRILRKGREFGEDKIKQGAGKINSKYGNILGSIKHKITGEGYEYIDPETGEKKIVKTNKVVDEDGNIKTGGLLGYGRDYLSELFAPMKDKGKDWFKKVSQEFDFGDSKDSTDIKSKRRRLIASSIGAMAGGGLLGGPIGLVMGAVAGNALSFGGIGDNIKEKLFGDGKDGKKKGLFTKVGDAIVNPIRFQFQKTAHHVGDKLRKNILGPLSDIGFAIKERITSAAKSRFSAVFKTIGNIILAPFKGIARVITAPLKFVFDKLPGMLGGAARATTTAVSGVTGFGLNRVADIIAGGKRQRVDSEGRRIYINKETGEERGFTDEEWNNMSFKENRQWKADTFRGTKELQERRNARNKDIEEGNKNNYFRKGGGKAAYKEWLAEDEARRAEMRSVRGNYIDEATVDTASNTEAILEEEKKQTQKLDEGMTAAVELRDAGMHEGSIYTHDKGLHERLDTIIDAIGGKGTDTKPGTGGKIKPRPVATIKDDNQSLEDTIKASQMISSITTSMQQGEVNAEEVSLADRATRELLKKEPNTQVLKAISTRMNRIQMSDKEKAEEKQETIWDKLLGFGDSIVKGLFGGGLSDLLKFGGIAGIIALLLGGQRDIGGMVSTIGGNISSAIATLFGKNGSDPTKNGVNGVLNLLGTDTGSQSLLSAAVPGTQLYHINTTAGGQEIGNSWATKAKNELWMADAKLQMSNAWANDMAGTVNQLNANAYGSKAMAAGTRASTYSNSAARGGLLSETQDSLANSLYEKQAGYASKAQTAQEAANATKAKSQEQQRAAGGSLIKSAGKQLAFAGITYAAGAGAGALGSSIASGLGADEQTAANVGNIANTGVSSFLTIEAGKNMLGRKNIFSSIWKAIQKAGEIISKKFPNFADKVAPMLGKIQNLLNGKLTTKVATEVGETAAKKTGESTLKQLSAGATVGLAIGLGALNGFINGTIGTEYLFGVLPYQADDAMYKASQIVQTVLGALDMTPYIGLGMVLWYALDAVMNGLGGTGPTQWWADALYEALSGGNSQVLDVKRNRFDNELNRYNTKFNRNLNRQEFNDLINSDSWIDELWWGKAGSNANPLADAFTSTFTPAWAKPFLPKSSGAENTAYDLMDEFDQFGNRKLKAGTLGYELTNRLTGGQYGITQMRDDYLAKKNSYMYTDADEANWEVRKDWATAAEVRNSMPAEMKKKLDDLNDIGKFAALGEEEFQWAQNLAYARLNDKKAVEQGIWKEESNGTITRTGSQSLANTTNTSIDNVSAALLTAEKIVGNAEHPYMPTDEEYKNWKPQKNFPFSWEIRQMLPDSLRGMTLDELYAAGVQVEYNGRKYNAAKMMAMAKVNEEKCIEAGIWKINDDGSVDRGDSQTIKFDTSKSVASVSSINTTYDENGNTVVGDIFGDAGDALRQLVPGITTGIESTTASVDNLTNVVQTAFNNLNIPTGGPWSDIWQKHSGGDRELGHGAPSAIKVDNETGNVYDRNEEQSQKLAEGGNPTDKEMVVSLPFGGLWGTTYTKNHPHGGIDMYPADGSGQANIISRWNGIITHVQDGVYGSSPSTGNNVSILTTNPTTGELMTVRHMHMKPNSIPSHIRENAEVHVGDKIGEMGTTGASTGVHLHYQMNEGDVPIASQSDSSVMDPTPFFSTKKNAKGINYTTNDVSTNTQTVSTDGLSTDTSSSATSTFASVIDKIKEVGNNFLYYLTGGLLGNQSAEEESNPFSINVSDQDTTTSSTNKSSKVYSIDYVNSTDAERVWGILKSLGYTDAQTAGILGNIMQENGVRARALEGDFYDTFDPELYDTITTDRDATDDWTRRVIKSYDPALRVNAKAYKGSDGHLYPGMGLVGFTGPETERYMKWAKANNMKWDNPAAQLAYMDSRIRNSKNGNESYYHFLKEKFNDPKRGPQEMAKAFYAHYTSGKGNKGEMDKWAQERAEYAQMFFDKYHEALKDKYPDVPNLKIHPDSEIANSETGGIGGGNYHIASAPVEALRKLNRAKQNATSRTYKPAAVKTPTGGSRETDLTEVVNGIALLGRYLEAIVDNTAESTKELTTLNTKDFGVDKELRDTLHAASKVKTHKQLSKGANTNSMKGIIELAKP